jgi:hypothetical protein
MKGADMPLNLITESELSEALKDVRLWCRAVDNPHVAYRMVVLNGPAAASDIFRSVESRLPAGELDGDDPPRSMQRPLVEGPLEPVSA